MHARTPGKTHLRVLLCVMRDTASLLWPDVHGREVITDELRRALNAGHLSPDYSAHAQLYT
jgi:hypothetical protein